MSFLPWVSDDDLTTATKHLLITAEEAFINSREKFSKNVIDPFAALFEIYGFNIDYDTWKKSEEARKSQKTLQNHIGEFHQIILGGVEEWRNLGKGNIVDLVSEQRGIIAEIKNKHNTVSGGDLANKYHDLDNLVSPKNSVYKGFTAYHVNIIPKTRKRFDKPFTPSNNKSGTKCQSNELIRHIDGASFYTLVTGRHDALRELYNVLPEVVSSLTGRALEVEARRNLISFFDEAFS